MHAPEKQARPAAKSGFGHLAIGKKGEDLAVDFLKTRRMTILERNWRPAAKGALSAGLRGLELDIVAREGDTLVFVEVKTRTTRENARAGGTAGAGDGGPFRPLDAYSPAKRAKLRKAVALYLGEKRAWGQPCRLDLVCVEVSAAGLVRRVELYQDALSGGEIF
ncbi:MAG: YraN family protein [Deltaproteobacteria bacterium]|jgi:putative endonuclease|nr:YraN family protein [Deltaproteobacteria bacterium]